MPISSVTSNPENLTLTVIGDYAVSLTRLWDAWTDPRKLEKFWGPQTWPATFTRHDMAAGGQSAYYMTGPEGETAHGWWRFLTVEPSKLVEIEDGFAHPDGTPNDTLPTTRFSVSFEETESGSRFTILTSFSSIEDMEQLTKMGMVEGMQDALSQLDAVLADLATFSANLPTHTQILSDTQVRISRVIKGTVEQVWRAHHEADLIRRWMLGPDGWTMPVCEPAAAVGETYRWEWESTDGSNRFGFEGELLEFEPPYRAVTTEKMIGTDGPTTINELTLTPVQGGTLLAYVATYPSAEVRDMILGTGMTDGMEISYQRMESEVLAAA
ncbi:SRPBCC family protein [Smaragdicoccus niigatensis]|uniref:SRPBCC family protein n=1 Tax=Smaragdicoccus niigatensis TaxID=359359 RepID=UPI0003783E25|nr:SRPBCC family protein [Smaragdicoccus niigatensis]